MLKLIVCDWNRTLHPDLYEEGYFGGLCVRACWWALGRGRLGRVGAMTLAGVRSGTLFLEAWRHRERALECVAEITELINAAVLRGLPIARVREFTRIYARRAAAQVDRRLLRPLRWARARFGVRLAALSSGSRRGVAASLARAGCPFDRVEANDFVVAHGRVVKLELSVLHNKLEVLDRILAAEGVTPAQTMFIGDSAADAECLDHVRWPVVSIMARDREKRRFAAEHGALAPADEEELWRHIRDACESP